MNNNLQKYKNEKFPFTQVLEMIPIFDEIPISEIRASDVFILQQLSEAAHHDGICLLLGVNFYDKNLVVLSILPDLKSKPKVAFKENPWPAIYIANDVKPDVVEKTLQQLSQRYDSLEAPPYQAYQDDDDTAPHDEWIEANTKARLAHDIFMRDHGMHQTSIPANYKR